MLRRDTGRMEARASEVFVGRARELEELERALDATRAGGRCDRPRRRRGGHRQDPARVRARDDAPATPGSRSSLGRSIDLVGTELPYQPFVEALRPLGELRRVDRRRPARSCACSRRRSRCSPIARRPRPVLLVLEDLHWADTSTLDLVVFLAHNLDDRRVLLLATYRADEPSSAERMRRLADGVRRSGSALAARARTARARRADGAARGPRRRPLPAALTDAIVARSEGNPFFAEELLAAAGDQSGRAPARPARSAAAARRPARPSDAEPVAPGRGRRARRRLPAAARGGRRSRSATCASRCARRSTTASSSPTRRAGSFRFRHALLAEAIYATILPGEREELHARLAEELARSDAAAPAELAPHWAAAGRSAEALVASVDAARAGGGRLRPRRGSRASRAGARAVARRAGRGRARRARPRRALHLGGRARQPGRVRRRARSSSHGERSSSSARATRAVPRSSTCASREYLHETGSSRRRTRRARARGRARAGASRPRRSARTRWGRSRAD